MSRARPPHVENRFVQPTRFSFFRANVALVGRSGIVRQAPDAPGAKVGRSGAVPYGKAKAKQKEAANIEAAPRGGNAQGDGHALQSNFCAIHPSRSLYQPSLQWRRTSGAFLSENCPQMGDEVLV